MESGGLDLEARGQGQAWRAFTGAGIPRDGGMADLLTEAAGDAPKFAAVICEDIERSGRDTFNALKLEKKLSRNGIPLFATDEPAVIDGVNATTVLVRRMKQGVAEWFRLQLKEKTWKGLVEHALDGWNIGPAPYGYLADRLPHPVPVKASQGRTKTRLAKDPDRAPVVEQIFTWRTVDKLGMPTIAARLNADPARYPAPTGKGWTTQTVFAVLGNPKYTGHMVYGRVRKRNGRRVTVPAGPVAVVPRAGPPRHRGPRHLDPGPADRRGARHQPRRRRAEHPPGHHPHLHLPGPHPVPGLPPPDGRHRLRPGPPQRVLPVPPQRRQPAARRRQPGPPPHRQSPRNPAGPDHRPVLQRARLRPRPRRPARRPAPGHRRRRDRRPRRPRRRPERKLRQLDTAQNAQILALEQLPADPGNTAAAAMRARITARFAELHADREHTEAQLAALTAATPKAADPTLLEELPLAGDILPGLPPS